MSIEKGRNHFLCEALYELKILQDLMTEFHSNYFGHLLFKIVGTDTIPFLLVLTNGTYLKLIDTDKQFETVYCKPEI